MADKSKPACGDNCSNCDREEMLREEALPVLQDSKGKCINSLEIHRDTAAKRGRVICFHIRLGRMGNGKSNCRKGELLPVLQGSSL